MLSRRGKLYLNSILIKHGYRSISSLSITKFSSATINHNILKSKSNKHNYAARYYSSNKVVENPNIRQEYGNLKDQDRIFTNLYHAGSFHIDDAIKRGDYYKTKDIVQAGRDWIIDELKKVV